jgi:adenylate cyclase
VTFSTGFVFVVALAGQIVFLIGPRNLGRLAIGRYQKPRELTADVMFVDLRGSTRLAELLGHGEYSALLRDFFIDASRAVHEARGEIYQYVGDEMIIVWPDGRAAGRWLDCFVRVRASIDAQRRKYMARYSIVPEFKAGVHSGSVIVTEVGVLQRALVYHGDVLNTAARIQGKCNETEFDLLVSEAVWSQLSPTDRARFASIGPVTLKGKEGMVELYGLIGSRVVAAGARGEASRRGDTGSRDRGP